MLRDAPADVLAYERRHASERWLVLVNFGSEGVRYAADGIVVVASDGEDEGASFAGRLGPDQALVLRVRS